MFQPGQKVTMILPTIFGEVNVREARIVRIEDGKPVYKPLKSKKEYFMSFKDDMLLFTGLILPFRFIDYFGDSSTYRFFLIEPDPKKIAELKQFIITMNINPHFNNWDKIMYIPLYQQPAKLFNQQELKALIK